MSTLLLDASVVLAAFDPDDAQHGPAAALLSGAPLSLSRPWIAIERIADDGGVVVSTGMLMTRAAELAERHSISVYDATYVAAAGEGDRSLVSCDCRDLVSNGLAKLPEAY